MVTHKAPELDHLNFIRIVNGLEKKTDTYSGFHFQARGQQDVMRVVMSIPAKYKGQARNLALDYHDGKVYFGTGTLQGNEFHFSKTPHSVDHALSMIETAAKRGASLGKLGYVESAPSAPTGSPKGKKPTGSPGVA